MKSARVSYARRRTCSSLGSRQRGFLDAGSSRHARIEYRDSAHCAEPTAAGSEESHGPIKFGELVKCAVGASPLLIAVSERIGGPDAPVRPDPMGRQLPRIDQLDHEWAGNAQEIRNLLRGHVLPSTEDRGGFARGDSFEKFDHQRDGGRGERDIAHPRHPDDGPGVSLRSACRERPGAGCSRPAIGSARALRLVGLSGHDGHGTVAPDQTKQTKHNSERFRLPVMGLARPFADSRPVHDSIRGTESICGAHQGLDR